jgi:type VI secretion system protein ImpG
MEGNTETVPFTATGLSGTESVSNPVYHENRRESLLQQGFETHILLKMPSKTDSWQISSLSADLLCTNDRLPEKLRIGDIIEKVDNSPGFVTFTNCIPVTSPLFGTLGDNRLWRLFGMQFINLKLLTAESLRSTLKLIYSSAGQDRQSATRNENYIEAIKGFHIEACDRIVKQVMKRGWNIRIMLAPDCFCSPGDLYLFGEMLDYFLRGFVAELYFSRTIIKDARSGGEYEWPARMGRKALL